MQKLKLPGTFSHTRHEMTILCQVLMVEELTWSVADLLLHRFAGCDDVYQVTNRRWMFDLDTTITASRLTGQNIRSCYAHTHLAYSEDS